MLSETIGIFDKRDIELAELLENNDYQWTVYELDLARNTEQLLLDVLFSVYISDHLETDRPIL